MKANTNTNINIPAETVYYNRRRAQLAAIVEDIIEYCHDLGAFSSYAWYSQALLDDVTPDNIDKTERVIDRIHSRARGAWYQELQAGRI